MAQALAEKLEHIWPAEKKIVASVPQRERAVGKYARAAFVEMKSNRAVGLVHQIVRWVRVKVNESLGERWGSERENGEKRVDSTVKEGRFQGGEGGQARRASVGRVEGSMSG